MKHIIWQLITPAKFHKVHQFVVDMANTYRCNVNQKFVSFLFHINNPASALLFLKQWRHFLLKFLYFCTGFINKLKDKTNTKRWLTREYIIQYQLKLPFYRRIFAYDKYLISITNSVSDVAAKTLVLNIETAQHNLSPMYRILFCATQD